MINTSINAIAATIKRTISRLRARVWARRRTNFKGVIVRAWLRKSAYSTVYDIEVETEYLDYIPSNIIHEYHVRAGGRDIIYKVEVRRPTRRWRDVYKATQTAHNILKPFTISN